MIFDLVVTIILVLAVIAGYVAWLFWRHYEQHRALGMRYESHSLTPPPSSVCPQCRRRSYSRRAVFEQYCEPCDLYYGEQKGVQKTAA